MRIRLRCVEAYEEHGENPKKPVMNGDKPMMVKPDGRLAGPGDKDAFPVFAKTVTQTAHFAVLRQHADNADAWSDHAAANGLPNGTMFLEAVNGGETKFVVGQDYYVDISPAPVEETPLHSYTKAELEKMLATAK